MKNKNVNDSVFMQRAIDLAVKAKGNTSPNPVVGAVIVKNGKVISEGFHRCAGSDHAEIVAIKKAGAKAKGAGLYVTLEPCYHYGKTPPCVDAIIKSGIKEVVIAMKDPNPKTQGKSIIKLKKSAIKTKVGILKRQAQEINEAFIKYIDQGMPLVTAKCAQTLDGKIATALGNSKWITSKPTREYAHKQRDEFDAILVGINTVLKDDPQLNGYKKSKKLKKIVLDSSLKISLEAELFKSVEGSVFIATTKKASKKKTESLLSRGVNVIICPEKNNKIDLKWLFKKLAQFGILSILIEGGAHVIGSALYEKLVDKMQIYIAPKIIGDQKALSSIAGLNIRDVNKAVQLEKIKIKLINKEILVSGYVLRNN